MALLKDTSTLDINKIIRAGAQYKAIKIQVNLWIAQFETGGTSSDILGVVRHLQTAIPALEPVRDDPAMTQLAVDIYGDVAYDIVLEMGNLITLIDNVITDIIELIPKNGSYLNLYYFDANNIVTPRVFTGTQLQPVIAKLQAIADKIQ